MKKGLFAAFMILTLVFTGACGKRSAAPSKSDSTAVTPSQNTGAPSSETDNNQSVPANKKIIQNYNLSIISEDIKKAADDITIKVKSLGGYIENEEANTSYYNSVARVPADKTEEFIQYLDKNFDLENRQKSMEDITEVYVDNDARIKNMKAEEAQIIEVLKKADTVDDILKVQSELFKVRGEIEALEAKKKMWDRQVDYSTIRISVSKRYIVSENKIRILSPGEFLNSSWKGFENSVLYVVLGVQKFLIFIFTSLVPIAIVAVIAMAVYKMSKKFKK